MKKKNKKKNKTYIVKMWSRGFSESSDAEFKNYEDAKKCYDENISLYGGDIEIKLVKVKELHFEPYWVDCD